MGSETPHPTKARALPSPGEVIDGRYRLKEVIASGGMGVIMRAEQVRTGRDVAVKLLHPHIGSQANFAARFMREAQVATLFDHPHIVRVYDVGETSAGALYLVMELLEGVELKDVIAEAGPMSAAAVFDIGLQMLDGLAEAHSHDVIHRDFKPSNIFVGKNRRGENEVKLLDFGIAKLLDGQEMQLTATGNFTGTPAYVAPETILLDPQEVDLNQKAGDVYAAGLVLLEMLVGKRILDGGNVAQTLLLHLQRPIFLPEALAHTALGAVIRRATMKHPDDRYRDGDAMYRALRDAQSQTPAELLLRPEEIPDGSAAVSAEMLQPLAGGAPAGGLDYLRSLPQHEIYRPPGQGASPKVVAAEVGRGSETPSSSTLRKITIPAPITPTPTPRPTPMPMPQIAQGLRQEPASAPAPLSPAPSVQDRTQSLGMLPLMVEGVPGKEEASKKGAGGAKVKIGIAVAFLGIVLVGVVAFLQIQEEPSGASFYESSLVIVEEEAEGAAPEEGALLGEASGELASAQVLAEVYSEPAGAEVYDGESRLGETPLEWEFEESDLPVELRLVKEGFEEAHLEFDGRSPRLEVELVSVPQEKPARTTRARSAKSKVSGLRQPQRVPSPPRKVTPPPVPLADEAPAQSEPEGPSIDRLLDDLLPSE